MDQLFGEPSTAIIRNAIVIAVGFLPLLLSNLVPYNTVGILLAAIMGISAPRLSSFCHPSWNLARRWFFGHSSPYKP
ncbi:MAG: hypothetical protein R3C68_02995 [Myxococcota bacterium]